MAILKRPWLATSFSFFALKNYDKFARRVVWVLFSLTVANDLRA